MLYNPPQFRVDDLAILHAHIAAAPFATLTTVGPDGPLAMHLPMLLDAGKGEHGTLIGHVARANPFWQQADTTRPALAIFHGPDAYVSPSWYPSKAEHGRVVPTWNYAVVHVRGSLRFTHGKDELHAIVDALTTRHEQNRPAAWKISDAPERYIASQLAAIVGLELAITSIEGKYKLSQNRDANDRAGATSGLTAEPDARAQATAALMKAQREK